MRAFGSWLKQRRLFLGLTQKELALKVGCSPALIRKIEAGERRPSRQIAELLVQPLEISEAESAAFLQFARGHTPPGETASFSATVPNPESADSYSFFQYLSPLTQRENDILRLMTQDVSDSAIAERLSLKIGTVRWYVKQIYSKLGVHSRDEAIQHAAAADLPTSTASLPVAWHNLPVQLSSFIGREWEIAEVRRVLASSRLVTLTGVGGCGKTRLALQVAAEVLHLFAGGARFVDLAPLADPALVPQAVAMALGLREAQDRPLLTALLDYLCRKHLLLVLDNCEHLIEACAQLADTLLRSCPELVILTTSREPLNITGESVWIVPPLSLPDLQPGTLPDNPMQYDAVRLFVERAVAVAPTLMPASQDDIAAIIQLCQRLDGLPLAIELTATRVKALTVGQIATRLEPRFQLLSGGSRTAPPRQQTLQATMDWSYNLLTAQAQTLFHRLSVFAGGWTLEAAEAVCSGEGIHQNEVAALLAHLVNASLVVVRQAGHYRLLETIRHFAREKLLEAGAEVELRSRHLEYVAGLAEKAEPRLTGPDQAIWLNRLENEQDNVRAALAWSLKSQVTTGLRLASALWRVPAVFEWRLYPGYPINEAVERLAQLLAQPGAAPRTAVRAKALGVAAVMITPQNDSARARSLAEESLAIYRELGDKRGEASSLFSLGYAATIDGPTSARPFFLESLSLYRSLLDRQGISATLMCLAFIERDYTEARAHLAEALAICRELGDMSGIAGALGGLGVRALRQGDFSQARTWLEESLALQQALRGPSSEIYWLGQLALFEGDYTQARACLEQSLAISQDVGDAETISWSLVNLGYVDLREEEEERAQATFVETLRRFEEIGNRIGVAYTLEGFASLAARQGRPERAVRLLAWTDAKRKAIGDPRPPVEQANVDRDLATIRSQVDAATVAMAWAEGQAMTMERAIVYALGQTIT